MTAQLGALDVGPYEARLLGLTDTIQGQRETNTIILTTSKAHQTRAVLQLLALLSQGPVYAMMLTAPVAKCQSQHHSQNAAQCPSTVFLRRQSAKVRNRE